MGPNLLLIALNESGYANAPVSVQAIVVLGGRPDRSHEAAKLHRSSGRPIYAAGEDVSMALQYLHELTPHWTDTISTDTETNAMVAACVLPALGVQSILLVTDAWHMRRAMMWFTYYGFHVVPHVSEFTDMPTIRGWWDVSVHPDVKFARKQEALHEWLGLVEFWWTTVLRVRKECPRQSNTVGPSITWWR